MKSAHRSILVLLVPASLALSVACGSDGSGLFTTSTDDSVTSIAGSLGTSIGSGSSVGGLTSSASGSSNVSSGEASSGAGHSSTGGDSVGGTGSSNAGSSASPSGGSLGNGVAGGSAAGSGVAGSAAAGAGSAAAGAGGAGAQGGSTSGGTDQGGSSAAATGGSVAGGMSGGAGTANGGSGGATDVCPAQGMHPANGDDCTTATPDGCYYPGLACSCLATGTGLANARKWACYGTPDSCPQDGAPTPGADCTAAGTDARCPYSASSYCVCAQAAQGGGQSGHFNNGPTWKCSNPNPPVCPLNGRPAKNDTCDSVRECNYANRGCFCDGSNWLCEGDTTQGPGQGGPGQGGPAAL